MTETSAPLTDSSAHGRNQGGVNMPERRWSKTWTNRMRQKFMHLPLTLLKYVVNLGTFPYYRMFQFNTYQPIILIAAYTSKPGKRHKLLFHLDRWRTRKLSELQFVSIGSAILAAATIGSFSWAAVADAYWLASAFWYSSLILSILGLLLAAQQVSVLQLLGKPPTQVGEGYAEREGVRRFLPLILTEVRPRQSRGDFVDNVDSVGEWRPRWKMVFIWQCPMMFLSYSVCLFLAGLTLFVCTPLIRGDEWNTGSNVAVVYLATGALALAIFIFASFWIYHYVDLDHESRDVAEPETDAEMLREYDRLHFT